jgi:hypothetical protein
VEAIALTIDVGRPAVEPWGRLRNTRFAAVLRLAAPIPFYLFAGGVEAIDRTIDVGRPLSSHPAVEPWGRLRQHPVRRALRLAAPIPF